MIVLVYGSKGFIGKQFVDLLNKRNVSKIDILSIDIDSYDYFIAKKIWRSLSS